jgi:hypothetical protein
MNLGVDRCSIFFVFVDSIWNLVDCTWSMQHYSPFLVIDVVHSSYHTASLKVVQKIILQKSPRVKEVVTNGDPNSLPQFEVLN